jgi:2'-5' RNA ligase
LFVALELPAGVRTALVNWAEKAVGGEPGVRLLDRDGLHLTLCFLGGVELSAVEPISEVLARAVGGAGGGGAGPGGGAGDGAGAGPGGGAGAGPLVFEPEEVRWLPPRRPRVCAVSLRDLDGRASGLQAALSARLSEGGWYEPERRRWLAHVTVARMSRVDRAERDGDPAPPELEPFRATAIALMRSWPGSRYEPLVRIAL